MITHHRSGHVILDGTDAKAISGLLRQVAAHLEHVSERGGDDKDWAHAMMEIADVYSDKLVPPTSTISNGWSMEVPRSLLVDESTEWVPLLRGHSLWSVALNLERAYAAKKGATSEEWDLLSVAKMAGIRGRIRVVTLSHCGSCLANSTFRTMRLISSTPSIRLNLN